ncbi:MAG: hypothetical protein OXI17_08450 [Gammaproteobacteria bacterium]|nr:hypothetical protein [Gammaproteobacteria bacterium]MDE0480807.1 hypothetical protein [Gammaproteobacteria bacterium]MDE0508646.1 hypothetical protein [Gammaproteobacteria bacterium]
MLKRINLIYRRYPLPFGAIVYGFLAALGNEIYQYVAAGAALEWSQWQVVSAGAAVGGICSWLYLHFVANDAVRPNDESTEKSAQLGQQDASALDSAASNNTLVHSPRTTAEIFSEIEGLTNVARDLVIARYEGAVLRVSGPVSNVSRFGHEENHYRVYVRQPDSDATVVLSFRGSAKASWAASLNKGDFIEASGVIDEAIAEDYLALEDCQNFPAQLTTPPKVPAAEEKPIRSEFHQGNPAQDPKPSLEKEAAPAKSPRTAAEIFSEIADKTEFAANRILARHKGKVLPITGTVSYVSESTAGTAMVHVRLLEEDNIVVLQFKSPSKFAWASSLDIGDTIDASGVIEKCFIGMLILTDCDDFPAERKFPNK